VKTVDALGDRIEAALPAGLVALVHALRAEGLSKQDIGNAMYAAFQRMQAADREDAADTIADILDRLTGWCSPNLFLLPGEPNVKLE
jgi:hypothetical protein